MLILAAAKQLVWGDRAARDGSAWAKRTGLDLFELDSSVIWSSPVNEFLPQGRSPKTYTIGDTLSYMLGRHSFRFGANFQVVRIRTFDDGGIVPGFGV